MELTVKQKREFTVATEATVLSSVTAPFRVTEFRRWSLVIHNTGGGEVQLLRYRLRSDALWPWGPWITATDITIAAGATASIDWSGGVADQLDVEMTATLSTSTLLYLAGSR